MHWWKGIQFRFETCWDDCDASATPVAMRTKIRQNQQHVGSCFGNHAQHKTINVQWLRHAISDRECARTRPLSRGIDSRVRQHRLSSHLKRRTLCHKGLSSSGRSAETFVRLAGWHLTKRDPSTSRNVSELFSEGRGVRPSGLLDSSAAPTCRLALTRLLTDCSQHAVSVGSATNII